MNTFYRGAWDTLTIRLLADEELGRLGEDYCADPGGISGQMTLEHASGVRWDVLFSVVTDATPEIPNDVLEGYIDLTERPDGRYRLLGRVRDVLGNVSAYGVPPAPGETVRELAFSVSPGYAETPVVQLPTALLIGGVALTLDLAALPPQLPLSLRASAAPLELPLPTEHAALTFSLNQKGAVLTLSLEER